MKLVGRIKKTRKTPLRLRVPWSDLYDLLPDASTLQVRTSLIFIQRAVLYCDASLSKEYHLPFRPTLNARVVREA